MTTETSSDTPAEPGDDRAPFLRVVRGAPTDEDLAALVSVLSAAASGGDTESPTVDNWGSPTSMHRTAAAFSPYAFGLGSHGPR